MRTFHTRHRVAHSAEEMFALVADIERYPEFLPLCESLRVRGEGEQDGKRTIVADMTVAYKMLRETFASRVTLDRENLTILVEYLDGPFKHLENRWRFLPESDGACEVDFYLEYQFKSRALQLVMGSMFDAAFARFSEAFEKRADVVYGKGAA